MGFFERRRWRFTRSRAAVALVLRAGPEGDEVLLTRRAVRPGDPWSGHVSFPGGRCHPEDVDPVATAVRETREELGLELEGKQVDRLSAHLAREHGRPLPMAVDPIVFRVEGDPEFTLNHEVEEAFWVPLHRLADGSLAAHRPWRIGLVRLNLPAWCWEGHTIWGLTYGMLTEWLRRADSSEA